MSFWLISYLFPYNEQVSYYLGESKLAFMELTGNI